MRHSAAISTMLGAGRLAAPLFVALTLAATSTSACPFCTALKPTLSQQRDSAEVVALGEVIEATADGNRYRLTSVVKGGDRLKGKDELRLDADASLPVGSLVLLMAQPGTGGDADKLVWSAQPLDEVGYLYFLKAPGPRVASAERLAFFIPFLEHDNERLAQDAYLEFGHAPYDVVAQVAVRLPMEKIRGWLVDPGVPEDRKGFYGLALGLTRDPAEIEANRALLKQLIEADSAGFRAGFDGILGGYLVAAGECGLADIETRILANPESNEGDVRHTMTALRFYHEFGREIPPQRIAAAMRKLLDRTEFAAAAIVDLARWQDWESLPAVATLYGRQDAPQPSTRRAVVGYLRACPTDRAEEELARLRGHDPVGVAEAERFINLFGTGR